MNGFKKCLASKIKWTQELVMNTRGKRVKDDPQISVWLWVFAEMSSSVPFAGN